MKPVRSVLFLDEFLNGLYEKSGFSIAKSLNIFQSFNMI
jgi:hypothetical protein